MSYPTKKDIGDRIKARREYLGISKLEMANLLGIGDRGYDHKEAARREITSTELAIIARSLGVTTDYLLGEDNAGDLREYEIVKFFNGLPEPIQVAELDHMRALHRAHVKQTGPKAIGSRSHETFLLEGEVPNRDEETGGRF